VSPISKQIITLGLIMVIIGLIPLLFGVDLYRLPSFIPSASVDIAGATTDTLDSANFSRDDQIQVVCTPWVGDTAGTPVTAAERPPRKGPIRRYSMEE